MKKSLILLFFSLLFLAGKSQKLDWFALNDCANIISTQFMEVDPWGNAYIVGQFQGETFFHSANPDGPGHHTYTNTSWKRTFLLKYDSTGNFQYFIKMYGTNSNGNYAEPRAFIRLSDGRLLLAAYTDNGIYIKDSEGKEQTVRGNKQIMLLFFNSEGKFLTSTPINLYHISKIVEIGKGNLCLLGVKESYGKRIPAISFLEATKKELQPFTLSDTAVIDIKMHNEKLWVLTAHESSERYKPRKQILSLYEMSHPETDLSAFRHFTQTFEGYQTIKSYLIEQPGKTEVAIQVTKEEKAVIKIGGLPSDIFKQNGLLIYHQNGQMKTRLDLDQMHGSSFRLQSRKTGGYLCEAYAREDVWIRRTHKIEIKPQPDYYWERLIILFDPFLQLEHYSPTGSSSLQQNGCLPRELNGKLYLSAPLVNFADFAGEYKKLNWKSGFYVARFSELTSK